MHTQSVRTTILMQPGLFKRLKIYSAQRGRPVSEIIEKAVRQVIEQDEHERLNRMYDGLFELAGRGKSNITDASSSIDETLYGEQGAWKGDNE